MVIRTLLILSLLTFSCSPTRKLPQNFQALAHNKRALKPSLNFDYGTLVELKVKIFDGDSLNHPKYQSAYLLEILDINGKKVDKPMIFEFEDHTYGDFPTSNFELYKLLYNEEVGSLDSEAIKEMKRSYVGKIFEIVAFESTKSFGKPYEIYKYTGFPDKFNFHFINYLVIVKDLNRN